MKNSLLLTAGSCAITLGYYESGDGGGANYIITDTQSTVDNGSVIALSNGKYAKLILDETFNIKQFGAKGDDNHDDTMSIYNCIQYIKSMSIRKTLKIPNGIYRVNTDSLADKGFVIDRINIEGEKCGIMQPYNTSKIIGSIIHDVSATSTKPLFYIGDPSNRTWGGFCISNLLVTGERQPRDAFFSYRHGWESFMDGVGIDNFSGGGLVLDSSYDGSYKDVTITRCGGATINSIFRASFTTIKTTDSTNACKFYNLHIEDTPYMMNLNGLRHCYFDGCKFEMGMWSDNAKLSFGVNCDLTKPPFQGKGLMEFGFNNCMFVMWGIPQYRENDIFTISDNDIPYAIQWKNRDIDKYNISSIKYTNCDFTTNSKGAAKLIDADETTNINIDNCIFDTVTGIVYPIRLLSKGSSISNSRIVIKNIDGQLRGLFVKNGTIDNVVVDVDNTVNDTLIEPSSDKYVVVISGEGVCTNCRVNCGKYKIGVGSTARIKRISNIVSVDETLIGAPSNYSKIELDLSIINSDIIKLSLSQDSTIVSILNGGIGENIKFLINNDKTYTFSNDSTKGFTQIRIQRNNQLTSNDMISLLKFDHGWLSTCMSDYSQ